MVVDEYLVVSFGCGASSQDVESQTKLDGGVMPERRRAHGATPGLLLPAALDGLHYEEIRDGHALVAAAIDHERGAYETHAVIALLWEIVLAVEPPPALRGDVFHRGSGPRHP